jgi:hypothetical protein
LTEAGHRRRRSEPRRRRRRPEPRRRPESRRIRRRPEPRRRRGRPESRRRRRRPVTARRASERRRRRRRRTACSERRCTYGTELVSGRHGSAASRAEHWVPLSGTCGPRRRAAEHTLYARRRIKKMPRPRTADESTPPRACLLRRSALCDLPQAQAASGWCGAGEQTSRGSESSTRENEDGT